MAKHIVEVRTIYEIDAPLNEDVLHYIGEDNQEWFTTGKGLPNVKLFSEDFDIIDVEMTDKEVDTLLEEEEEDE